MFIGSMHGVADSCSLNGGFRLDVANTRCSSICRERGNNFVEALQDEFAVTAKLFR
jgi:hypothetical protein